jgi:hypothetical protein
MVPADDLDAPEQVHLNAGRLWAGGAATAVVAALAVVAGVMITRGVLGIPVLAPKTANNFGNSATSVYALLAAGATLLATALLHVLLLGTPRPFAYGLEHGVGRDRIQVPGGFVEQQDGPVGQHGPERLDDPAPQQQPSRDAEHDHHAGHEGGQHGVRELGPQRGVPQHGPEVGELRLAPDDAVADGARPGNYPI